VSFRLELTLDLQKEASKYYWYHCVDLGNGVITDGDYDIRDLLPHYGFPERMDGMDVLDVARGSGFFAFEFERRGAAVTATDICSFLDWDFVGGDEERQARRNAIGDVEAFTIENITGAFEFASTVRKSRVISKLINVYEMTPEAFGNRRFDLVFAGSITSHLRDPILAFERLYKLTKHRCVVAAPAFEIPEVAHFPVMALVGTMDSDRRSWWVVNQRCLIEMLRCAGFRQVRIVSQFILPNRRVPSLNLLHLVAHADV
jgi:tRNA (mo5U34)-methyltransferase